MGERKNEAPRAPTLTITQPLISQMYQCVAPFRTQDTQNKPFEATKAEKLEVLMKDRTGREPKNGPSGKNCMPWPGCMLSAVTPKPWFICYLFISSNEFIYICLYYL